MNRDKLLVGLKVVENRLGQISMEMMQDHMLPPFGYSEMMIERVRQEVVALAGLRIKMERDDGWLPFESAPKKKGDLYIASDGVCVMAVRVWNDKESIAIKAGDDDCERGDLKYWRPLPDAPNRTEMGTA